jgi:hypothetical protein
MTENRRYYEIYNPQTLEIAPFMDEYDTALAELDNAMERIRKSPDTERIAALDADFDRTYSGMDASVKAYLHHFDPVVRTAAENLDVIFRHYGNIGRRPYREELAASHNLVQELRARQTDVAALNLDPWIAAHEAVATALAELLDVRTEATSHQTQVRAIDARRRMEAVYQQVSDRLDAVINLRGADFAGNFYNEYNAHATEYRNTLAQHLGRIRKPADKPAEQ